MRNWVSGERLEKSGSRNKENEGFCWGASTVIESSLGQVARRSLMPRGLLLVSMFFLLGAILRRCYSRCWLARCLSRSGAQRCGAR
ncbi:hypothetical protein LY78DRAFT_217593 [Colletotrichum sublineola]|nr:hypothetical protein LY78DRAFT_217593 [Colletotrichum sublineola]